MPLPAAVTIAAFSLSLPDLPLLIGRPLPSRPFLQLLEHRSNVIMTLFTRVRGRQIFRSSQEASEDGIMLIGAKRVPIRPFRAARKKGGGTCT